MPTGYTADIANGIDFKTFAMNCARAFGACVMLRDDPGGGEVIPERFAVDGYHAKQCEDAKRRLHMLLALTPEDAEKAASAEWTNAEGRRRQILDEHRKLRAAYEAMARKVTEWVPPTDAHVGLRDFMLRQIAESVRFDCDEDYYSKEIPRLSGEQWLREQLDKEQRNINFHAEEYGKEVARTEERNAWIRALRDSLKEAA